MTPENGTKAEHRFRLRVYYEDTDCMGVVYHANYLRFFERARTEAMATTGTTVAEWSQRGFIFPVYSVNLTFRAPAKLGDELEVISRTRQLSGFRMGFDQRIESVKDRRLLVDAKVDLVCIDGSGKLQTFPEIGI